MQHLRNKKIITHAEDLQEVQTAFCNNCYVIHDSREMERLYQGLVEPAPAVSIPPICKTKLSFRKLFISKKFIASSQTILK